MLDGFVFSFLFSLFLWREKVAFEELGNIQIWTVLRNLSIARIWLKCRSKCYIALGILWFWKFIVEK